MLEKILYREFDKSKAINLIVLSILFIFGLMVPLISYYLSYLLIFVTFIVIKEVSFRTDFVSNFLFAFLFSLLYAFVYYLHSLSHDLPPVTNFVSSIFYPVYLLLVYFFYGYYYSDKKGELKYLLVPVLGVILFAIMTTIKSFMHFGIQMLITRDNVSIWGSSSTIATILGVYLSLGCSLISIVFTDYKWYIRYSLFSLAGLSILSSYLLQTRSPIYAAVLSFGLSFLYAFYEFSFKQKIKIIVVSAFIGFLVIVTLSYSGLLDPDKLNFYLGRLSGQNVGGAGNHSFYSTRRYDLWLNTVQEIWSYPFGGNKISFYPDLFAHNMWLDIANYCGYIVMLLLIWFQFSHLKSIIKLIFSTPNSFFVLFPLLFSLFVSAFVEPLYIASPMMMGIIFYYLGILSYSNKSL